ncbi:MAG: hypothetical protein E6Z06_02780 [Clostridiales bacterium]|nr:hypothetical protein [Clostridiales bacterium]
MLNVKDISSEVVDFGKDVLNTNYSVSTLLYMVAAKVAVDVGVELIYELGVNKKMKNKVKNIKRKPERVHRDESVGIDVEV